MDYKPHAYQEVATQFILDHPYCGLFLDMGLGKSVITLTAIQALRDEYFDMEKCLVIAPKRVALETWPQEIEKWDHINLRVSMVTGSAVARRRALRKDADVYITTRDLVIWLVNELRYMWPFDTLVIDELSSFKNPSAKRFRALRKVRPHIKRVIGLTGTPKPNSYMDLWSELYLLDEGERLGRTVTSYRSTYFDAEHWGGFTSYTIRSGMDQAIQGKIKDICLSMKARDYLPLEAPTVIDRVVELPEKAQKVYKEMEREFYIGLVDGAEVSAPSAAVKAGKLLQMASGTVYDDAKVGKDVHDVKLEALKEMAELGENLLVFYAYKHEADRILAAIPQARKLETQQDIRDWNEGKIPVLLAHPASAGHGLNLQSGGHIIVWFCLTWSLELYEQANARLQRQGQTDPVMIYRLIAKDTIDEDVAKALEKKGNSQEAFLASFKARFASKVGA